MQDRPQLYRKKPDKEIQKKLATTQVNAYPIILRFANTLQEIVLGPIIDTSIQLEEQKQEPKYEPYIPESFKELEQKILYDPKPKSDIKKIEGVSAKESEMIDYWEYSDHGSLFWDRKRDGYHIQPAEVGEIYDFGEEKGTPAKEVLDDNYGANKWRDDTIFRIRENNRATKRKGRGSYENLGYYGYKSDYHKELFFEIIQALGLARKAEVRQPKKEIYDSINGLYHKVTALNPTKIQAVNYYNYKNSFSADKEAEL